MLFCKQIISVMGYKYSVLLSIHNHISHKISLINILLHIVKIIFYMSSHMQRDGLNIKSWLKNILRSLANTSFVQNQFTFLKIR